MTEPDYQQRFDLLLRVTREAGEYLREQYMGSERIVDEELAHDIKLRLDKEIQTRITDALLAVYPTDSVLGEESDSYKNSSDYEWIIDPIDGTVNFFYSIPIFCVSVALRHRDHLVMGCVYDPMQKECFSALRGQGAFCNDRALRVSTRSEMSQAVIFVGHGRHDSSGEAGLQRFAKLSSQVRKVRILGSAALTLCYIAAGRFDAYIENEINIWDFAAAAVILEEAGGRLDFIPVDETGTSGSVTAWNGLLPL